MTMGRFIGVGFAILVGEYTRLGMDLVTALEKVGRLGMTEAQILEAEREAAVPTPVDNAASMQALMGMMGGVRGAPV